MPTIEVDYCELERLMQVSLNGDMEKLDEILAFVKAEVKLYNPKDGVVSIEIKDTNRPDLWSVEGLARALRGFLNKEKGAKQYSHGDSTVEVHVDRQLWNIRPFIACSTIKDLQLTDTIIRGMMHLQDKLDKTYGRNRQKTSIGIYNLDLINPHLHYTVSKPKEISFVPLGFSERLNLAEILERHPKGVEYGHIVSKHSVYPILLDSKGKVLSFPPIINSNDLGRVTEETHNLLVEVTGTSEETVVNTLNLVTLALIDRGGKAYASTINYPDVEVYPMKHVVTPQFEGKKFQLDVDYTNQILGLSLNSQQISDLLLTAGFGVEKTEMKAVQVFVPCYRTDVMHQVDLVEDVAIAFGYNNIEPVWRELATTGRAREEQQLVDLSRELMVGAGYQEASTYTLTNPDSLFVKMNCVKEPVVEVANPKIVTMTCLRNWVLPSLMEFLSNNLSVEFPQRIFEVGKVALMDESKETKNRDEERLAAVTSHGNASFTEIKSVLDSFFMNLGLNWTISEYVHPSFIEGRAGQVSVSGVHVGFLGEIQPCVLNAWTLENPAAAFEINLDRVRELIKLKKK